MVPRVFAFTCCFTVIALARAEEPAVIPAGEAANHVGERCTVEFVVKSTGTTRGDKLLFLNSEEKYRSNTNFALVFDTAAVAKFKEGGVDNIEEHFFAKRIRATGTI